MAGDVADLGLLGLQLFEDNAQLVRDRRPARGSLLDFSSRAESGLTFVAVSRHAEERKGVAEAFLKVYAIGDGRWRASAAAVARNRPKARVTFDLAIRIRPQTMAGPVELNCFRAGDHDRHPRQEFLPVTLCVSVRRCRIFGGRGGRSLIKATCASADFHDSSPRRQRNSRCIQPWSPPRSRRGRALVQFGGGKKKHQPRRRRAGLMLTLKSCNLTHGRKKR